MRSLNDWQDELGAQESGNGRALHLGLPVPEAARARGGRRAHQERAAEALLGARAARAEPLAGVRRAQRAAAPAVHHPGPAGHRQDGDQRDHRVPPGEDGPRAGARLRALQHRRRPARREDRRHAAARRAPLRALARDGRLAGRQHLAAQPAASDARVRVFCRESGTPETGCKLEHFACGAVCIRS